MKMQKIQSAGLSLWVNLLQKNNGQQYSLHEELGIYFKCIFALPGTALDGWLQNLNQNVSLNFVTYCSMNIIILLNFWIV